EPPVQPNGQEQCSPGAPTPPEDLTPQAPPGLEPPTAPVETDPPPAASPAPKVPEAPVQASGQDKGSRGAPAQPTEGIICSTADPNKTILLSLDIVLEQVQKNKVDAAMIFEASATYVDLLAARAALGVALQTEEKLEDLLHHANALI